MRHTTALPPLALALILVGLSGPAGAQVPKPPDVQQAQKPPREILRDAEKKSGPPLQGVIPREKSPSQSGPGTNELPTNRGINMGKPFAPGFDPGSKIPGAGGADRSQPIGQTTPGLPTSTDPLANREKHDDKGKQVGPEYFSKEQQLKNLTDPRSGMQDAGMGGTEGKNPLDKSGQDLLGGMAITVTPGAGKNVSGKREQQSEDSGSPEPTPYPSGQAQSQGLTEPAQDKAPLTSKIPSASGDDAGTAGGVASSNISGPAKTTSGTAPVLPEGTGVIPKKPASGDKKTPNPETDTGDGHVPKGIIADKQPKSPSEMEAERKRQVTLPGEGQSQPERVYMSPEDALKGGIRKNTDGRIDPADPTATTPTGGGLGTTPRPGYGPERVDGRPGFAGGGGVPPRGGNTPDNPTASQSPTSSQAPSTSTDRNTGDTTGDSSNKP